ncbi:MAG TPA: hypothetical protein VGG56_06075 [Terracidiphilus sp.]|jgi:hypothetical protein
MKTIYKLVALLLFTVAAAAHAQVAPAATMGPAGLRYTFRYSETAEFYDVTGNRQTISPSASVEYVNNAERRPFSMKYSGGYTWNVVGPSYATGLFQRLALSQSLLWRKWDVNFSDNVGYLPESPITGFSGIAGTGEPIGEPNPIPSGQSILEENTHVVNNLANGTLTHQFNRATSFSAGGSSDLLRFPEGIGLDTDTVMANGELAWQFNARNRISGNYRFSQFTYPGYDVTFSTNATTFGYFRQWNRRINTNVEAGPEFIGSADTAAVPNSTRLSANAAVTYRYQFGETGLNYTHGTNGGAGYLLGAEFDTARAYYSRDFERNLTVGFDAAYTRTSGLINNGITDARFAGVQVTRRVGQYLTVFGNYTAIDQTTSSVLYSSALTGLEQVVSFGIGYSPRGTRIIRH